MDKQLLKNLIGANYTRSKNDDFADGIGGTVKVFSVDGETLRCKIWNSSDNSSFDVVAAMAEIAKEYLEDEDLCEGRVSLGLKEIWYEIIEK